MEAAKEEEEAARADGAASCGDRVAATPEIEDEETRTNEAQPPS